MKKINILFILAIGLLCHSLSFSQNANHFYGGIGAGIGQAKIDDERINSTLLNGGASSTTIINDRRDATFKAFGGYQITPYIGIEAGYFNLGNFGFKSTTIPTGALNGNVRLEGINLDIIGYAPINDKLSAIGRVGIVNTRSRDTFTSSNSVAINNSNSQLTDTNYKLGLGLSYNLNKLISLRGEFERYRINDGLGNKGDVNVAILSLVFPFGHTPEAEPKVIEHVQYEVTPIVVVVSEDPKPPQDRIIYEELPAPLVVAPMPEHLHVSFNSDVLFGFDRAILSTSGKTELDKFGSELNSIVYDHVTVVGHTDRIGSDSYNERLSKQRADSVKTYFVSRGIIPENKIEAEGRGSSEPITDSGACKGLHSSVDAIVCLAQDRRVEVDVVGITIGKQ